MNEQITKEYLAYTLERLSTDNKADECFYKAVAGVLRKGIVVDTIQLDYVYSAHNVYRINLIETRN